jgi:hypothetical protein
MPRYFLHLIGSVTWEVVEIGDDVSTAADAWSYGRDVAYELAVQDSERGSRSRLRLLVVDEDGLEIGAIEIADVLT